MVRAPILAPAENSVQPPFRSSMQVVLRSGSEYELGGVGVGGRRGRGDHAGNPDNELADRLAVKGMREAINS